MMFMKKNYRLVYLTYNTTNAVTAWQMMSPGFFRILRKGWGMNKKLTFKKPSLMRIIPFSMSSFQSKLMFFVIFLDHIKANRYINTSIHFDQK